MEDKKIKLDVDVSSLPTVSCKRCKGIFFRDALIVKRVSPLVSPDGKEAFIPIPVLLCVSCGEPLNAVGEKKDLTN